MDYVRVPDQVELEPVKTATLNGLPFKPDRFINSVDNPPASIFPAKWVGTATSRILSPRIFQSVPQKNNIRSSSIHPVAWYRNADKEFEATHGITITGVQTLRTEILLHVQSHLPPSSKVLLNYVHGRFYRSLD